MNYHHYLNHRSVTTGPLLAAAVLGCSTLDAQSFIDVLDGASGASTFETGVQNQLPSLGWRSISGLNLTSALIYDASLGNGALIGDQPYVNYRVEFDTTTPILANSTYTLTLQMGYISVIVGGNSGYSFQLGTVNGGIFTGLGTAASGTIAYAGNLTDGSLSVAVSQVFNTGGSVSGDNLAVQWEQTSSLGAGSSFFGFDNVTFTVSPIPEPSEYAVFTGAALLGLVVWRRRSAR